jgi:hypothetical protein
MSESAGLGTRTVVVRDLAGCVVGDSIAVRRGTVSFIGTMARATALHFGNIEVVLQVRGFISSGYEDASFYPSVSLIGHSSGASTISSAA